MPYPVNAQAWTARYLSEDELVPLIDCRLAGERFTLRLRGGNEFGRQLRSFGQIVAGDAIPCELTFLRQRVEQSDHRPGLTAREPGGGAKATFRIMAKIAAWLPRTEAEKKEKELLLASGSSELWCAVVEGREPWILNADFVRRWIARHVLYLSRLSHDTKFEKRWPAKQRQQINEARKLKCDKFERRIQTFCHTAARMLVEFAKRQSVGKIIYNDSDQAYMPSFQWFKLKTLLRQKCDESGIAFQHANPSADVTPKNADALADQGKQ
jgi:hypothetical protein